MAHKTTSIGKGKLFVQKEDGSMDYLGEAKLAVMPREAYLRLQAVCSYHGQHVDDYDHRLLVGHCNHPKNRPHGCSWGKCEWLDCPLNWGK